MIEGSTAIWPGHPARVEVHGTDGSAYVEDGAIKFWQFKKALALFEKACRYRIYLVSLLPPDQVRQMGLIPAADPAEALRQALGGLPKAWRGVVLPQAGVTLCRVEPAA